MCHVNVAAVAADGPCGSEAARGRPRRAATINTFYDHFIDNQLSKWTAQNTRSANTSVLLTRALWPAASTP